MSPLLRYLNSLPPLSQRRFAGRCKTSVGYIRKAVCVGSRFGFRLCIAFERESARAVTCEQLRPDVDWAYLRGTRRKRA